jgi:LPXTG-site transpeptidase (sortase) family protein
MKTATFLHWLERALLAAGLALCIWCGAVLLDAHFVAQMPVPDPPKTESVSIGTIVTEAPGRPATPTTGSWVARLEAPSVRLSATVLEGTDDGTLARGAGHIEDTPFPGQPGNIGIAGHRDTTFRAVRNLKVGDPLELTTSDRIYRYSITKAFIVEPEDVYVLDPGDRPMLTLVTCYPFTYIGHAPHRYVLQAVLVDQEARRIPDASGQGDRQEGLERQDNKAPRGILIPTTK